MLALSSRFQVTWPWSLVVTTSGEWASSRTAIVTRAPSTSCTSRTTLVTRSPHGEAPIYLLT